MATLKSESELLATPSTNRLFSLDVFRGITMFLLLAEAAGVYGALTDAFPRGIGHSIVEQFHHHPWNGLRFWDLIQPFFMFIVGVAMPFSLRSRLKKGQSWAEAFRHILRRCFLLFLFGTGLHCVYSGRIVFELWNVLTQLSFTILLTFLVLQWEWRWQLLVSVACLVLAEVLYRIYDPSAPFVKDENFGSYVDLLLMGKINNGGGWVTINCLSTAAHTIWGAMCGYLLLRESGPTQKIKALLLAGAMGLVLGYGLDLLGVTPIVKRIATTSFVLASGGWAIGVLALLYWLVDVKDRGGWGVFFAIVGMNSIFIYLFAETIGGQWLRDFGMIFTNGVFSPLGFSPALISLLNSLVVLGMFWYLCYFMYRKRVFIKI